MPNRQSLVFGVSLLAVSLFCPDVMAQSLAAKSARESPRHFMTGYLSRNSGGTLSEEGSGEATTGYGASWTFGARHLVSGEVELDYTPQFFGPESEWERNSVLTIAVGAIVGPTMRVGDVQRVRPYVSAGVGLIRSHIQSSVESLPMTNPLAEAGAGFIWFPNRVLGLRADLRYCWDTGDLSQRGGYVDTLNYIRASLGLSLAF